MLCLATDATIGFNSTRDSVNEGNTLDMFIELRALSGSILRPVSYQIAPSTPSGSASK